MQVSHNDLIESALARHDDPRDAIRWAIQQESIECERLCRVLADDKTNAAQYRNGAEWSAIRIAARRADGA